MDDILARMRQEYGERGLRRKDVVADPLEQFTRWFDEARNAPILEPNGMPAGNRRLAPSCSRPSIGAA